MCAGIRVCGAFSDLAVNMLYQLLAINALPLFLSGIAWWIRQRDSGRLLGKRWAAFLIAIVANTISSGSLLIFLLWLFIGAGHPFGGVIEDRLFLSMIGLGLLSAGLAVCGNGLSRGVLVANGFFVAIEWWLLAAIGL